MRKTAFAVTFILLFLVAAFLAGVNSALVEDSWLAVAPLPTSFDVLGAASVDGKIYLIGYDICERYDLDTNTWSSIAPLPIYTGSAVVACQNKIYVIGGDPTQVYDPATATWENRTSIPATIYRQQANVVDDKIYVIFGQQPSPLSIINPSDINYVYDPAADSWSEMTPIPTPVEGYASAVLDNKLYIIGGGTGTSTPNNATDLVQIFDPETNQWTNGKPIPTGVYKAAACSTSGLIATKRIYVVGGSLRYDGGGLSVDTSAQTVTNLTQVYDAATGSWSLATSIPESRRSFSLINVNDALYAVGGVNGNGAIERYIPVEYDESLLITPSPTPTPTPDGYAANIPIALSAVIIVIVAIAGLAVYHKKHNKNT
jgi:N-acetylneuraminic acid mutarotase